MHLRASFDASPRTAISGGAVTTSGAQTYNDPVTLGANAVVGVEFDSSEIGQMMTEVLAYGTAVVVEKELATSSPVRLS